MIGSSLSLGEILLILSEIVKKFNFKGNWKTAFVKILILRVLISVITNIKKNDVVRQITDEQWMLRKKIEYS